MKRHAVSLSLAIATVSLLGSIAPSRAAVNTVVSIGAFGPNSYGAGAVVVKAAPANYVNADPLLASHNIESDGRTSGKPWCGPSKPFPNSRCPIFYANYVQPQNGPTPINGVADLAPGTYGFHCGIHDMTGSIQVVA